MVWVLPLAYHSTEQIFLLSLWLKFVAFLQFKQSMVSSSSIGGGLLGLEEGYLEIYPNIFITIRTGNIFNEC